MSILVASGASAVERPAAGPARYLVAKLTGAATSLLLVILSGFFLFRVIPGNPVAELTRGANVSAVQQARLRHQLGLDRPWYAQFASYLTSVVRGDFGTSFTYDEPVSRLIAERLWPTVLLVGSATIIAIVLGTWLGAHAAWRHGGAFDKAHTSVALMLWSIPTFWLGLLLLMAFGVGVGPIPGLFPTGGMSSPDAPPGLLGHCLDVLHHLVLPCLTLVMVLYAQNLLVMRSSLLEELGNDYLTTASAKGLRSGAVRRRHAMPNALLPAVTLIFLQLGFVVSGAVTVEVVYSWPGLGSLLYDGINVPDQPLLQGTFIVFSAAVIVMNTLADIACHLIDPRARSA